MPGRGERTGTLGINKHEQKDLKRAKGCHQKGLMSNVMGV